VRAQPRTQSSLAIRGNDGPWFLVNASPDLRQQLETLTPRHVDDVRAPPVAGVLLTDAEIDHTAGLLLLRESVTPVRVFGDAGVEHALTHGYPVLPMLERYCGAEWQTLEPARPKSLEGSSLEVEAFGAGGDAPRYLNKTDVQLQSSGLVFRDRASGGVVTYVPGLARLDHGVLTRFAASDLVLVDGTFWRDDELARLGISARSARDMGHVPLSGPGGTLEALAGLERPRKALVHINNTNPILLEDSPERNEVLRAGVEVAYDGLEVELPPSTAEPGTAARREDSVGLNDEFIARLRAQGTRYHNLHPFHRRMDAGELTREELQRWVANRFYYQKSIPLKDAAILSNCPEVEVRRDWIKRILDHDGTTDGTGGIESWLRLGEALGVPREELVSERRVLPAVRYAVDAYVNFARRKPWIEAVASSLTELFGPAAIRVRLDALERHYAWIDPAGLEYFRTRLEQAPRDARYALDLTVERCQTREQQDAAVAALRFKTEMLWVQLDAIERGDTQPPEADA
jgi:coenzyme PQQ biosynthesis protein C/coenzyme PQQ biosynthesis protein B